jgi:hypothetical protein
VKALADELLAMAEEDLRVRTELAADGSLFEGYHPRMRAVHDRNAARLKPIVEAHGWPTRSAVGDDASHAAWLVLQHAIGHPALQRDCLVLLQALPEAEVDPVEVGMLEDRIRVFEGRGQLLGTQFDWDADGEMSPLPIEAPEQVDARRAAIGLRPLAEEIEARRLAVAKAKERPPADRAARERDYQAWLREVGWR